MADTATKSAEVKKEYFDTPAEFDTKCDFPAQWIKSAGLFDAFTGSGISTAAGIPDFRSGYDQVLEPGPGAWEKAALKAKVSKDKKIVTKPIQKAMPSLTHMAFVSMLE